MMVFDIGYECMNHAHEYQEKSNQSWRVGYEISYIKYIPPEDSRAIYATNSDENVSIIVSYRAKLSASRGCNHLDETTQSRQGAL